MQLSDLYGGMVDMLLKSTNWPSFVPLIGNLRESASEWAKANPSQARQIVEKMDRLIREYKENER